METSRLWFYFVLAMVTTGIFYCILVKEPFPDGPINLIHLLAKH